MIVWVATACGSKVVYHTLHGYWRHTVCGRLIGEVNDGRYAQFGTYINVNLLNPDRARPCKRCWPDE